MSVSAYKILDKSEWQIGDYRTIAFISRTADVVLDGLLPKYHFYNEEGLGEAKTAYFAADEGFHFMITEFLNNTPPITEFLVLYDPETMLIELEKILSFFNLLRSDLDFIYKF